MKALVNEEMDMTSIKDLEVQLVVKTHACSLT